MKKIRRQVITNKTKLFIPLLVFSLFLLLGCIGSVSASEWTVGNNSSYNFNSIQDAINNASTVNGDIITVDPNGTDPYRENVVVNKNLTIKANGTVTVTALVNSNSVFRIITGGSGSTIQGFIVNGVPVGATTTNGAINLYQVDHCSIINNTVSGNWGGIRLEYSDFNNISGNIVTNSRYGIRMVSYSDCNNIYGNTVLNNEYGISTTSNPLGNEANFNIIVGNNYGINSYFTALTNIENNWWGSNNGPNGAGSDNSNLPCGQWLILTVNANPNSIDSGETSTITADLNHVNGGAAVSGGHVPDGTIISFTTDLGTITPTATTLNGEATATLSTSALDVGTATVHALVDNEDQQTTVTVTYRPVKNIDTGKTYASLKEAVDDPETLGGNTLTMKAGTYTGLNNRDIVINKDLTIIGENKATTIINAENLARIFMVNSGINLILQKLTLTNGKAPDGVSGSAGGSGGAIYNEGTLQVTDCIFSENRAGNGGSTDTPTYGGSGGSGGAIYSTGSLNIMDSVFSSNAAGNGGDASAFMAGSGGSGGAICSTGFLNVIDSVFSANIAGQSGLGLFTASNGTSGAIDSQGNGEITNSTFTGNIGYARGGAIRNSGTLTVRTSTFSGNSANYGGALRNYHGTLNVIECSFLSNIANGSGGAIYNDGTSTVTDCTFTDNSAAMSGGALYNDGISKITGCTLANNSANWDGGAIRNYGTLNSTSSIFTNNNANRGGGAISNDWGGTCEIHFNRIVGNTATNGTAIFCNSGLVNATNNWWGSNNPVFDTLIVINGSGVVNHTNWLYMNITATPGTINDTQTSLITVSFNNYSSDGITYAALDPVNGHIPDGTPVTFSLIEGLFGVHGTLTPPLTVNTVNGIVSILFTATSAGVQEINATTDDQNITATVTINPASYVDVSKEFRDLPWGNVIEAAYYHDVIYAMVRIGNQGPDATSLIVQDLLTGMDWTGNYYTLSGSINPADPGNWVLNDLVNTFNGVNWTIPNFNSAIGGNVKWLALEVLVNQTGTVSNYAETISQSAYAYNGLDNATAYLTANLVPTTLTVDNVTGNKGQTVDLTATLLDTAHGNVGVEGKTIVFKVNGVDVGNALTDVNGVATLHYTIDPLVGTYNIDAEFVADDKYAGATGTGTLKVPKASIYVLTTVSKTNPTVGETITMTFKLGNDGPDAADEVVFTYVIPEGMEFVSLKTEPGYPAAVYNPATRTVTWNVGTVPVLDPWLKINLRVLKSGNYNIKPTVTTTTYDPTIDNSVQKVTIKAFRSSNAHTTTVNAATQVNTATATGNASNQNQSGTNGTSDQNSSTNGTAVNWFLSYWWIIIILLLIAGGLYWYFFASKNGE